MEEKEYIDSRLQPQIDYYTARCTHLKREYYWLSIITIVANALIPVITLSIDSTGVQKYIVASLSAVATILSSILMLKKTRDTWVEYRFTCEALKREQAMFETKSGKYAGMAFQAFQSFVTSCENIMASENSTWLDLIKSEKVKEKGN